MLWVWPKKQKNHCPDMVSVADREIFFQGDEGDYSEEENSKVELKSEANDAANSSAKEEKGEEKPDSKGTVTGERQSGDGQVSTHRRPSFGF